MLMERLEGSKRVAPRAAFRHAPPAANDEGEPRSVRRDRQAPRPIGASSDRSERTGHVAGARLIAADGMPLGVTTMLIARAHRGDVQRQASAASDGRHRVAQWLKTNVRSICTRVAPASAMPAQPGDRRRSGRRMGRQALGYLGRLTEGRGRDGRITTVRSTDTRSHRRRRFDRAGWKRSRRRLSSCRRSRSSEIADSRGGSFADRGDGRAAGRLAGIRSASGRWHRPVVFDHVRAARRSGRRRAGAAEGRDSKDRYRATLQRTIGRECRQHLSTAQCVVAHPASTAGRRPARQADGPFAEATPIARSIVRPVRHETLRNRPSASAPVPSRSDSRTPSRPSARHPRSVPLRPPCPLRRA